MKKRIIIIVLLLVFTANLVFTQSEDTDSSKKSDFFVARVRVSPIVDINEYFRGAAIGTQIFFNIFGIHVGGEAMFEYDTRFHVSQAVTLIEIGLGPNFWIAAGQTWPAQIPIAITDNTLEIYEYGTFPNTFGLGFAVPVVDLGWAELGVASMFTYTIATPVLGLGPELSFNDIPALIMGILGNIKGYLSIELKFGF